MRTISILESLAHGKPCVCSARGAVGETARAGGCLALPDVGPADLAAALRRLLTEPATLAALAAAARARPARPWSAYAAEVVGWQRSLRRLDRARPPFHLP